MPELTAQITKHPETLDTSEDAVYLRLTQDSDAEELFGLIDANRAFLREYQGSVAEGTYSIQDVFKAVKLTCIKMQAGSMLQYRIIKASTDTMAGTVTLYNHDAQSRTAKLGYWLAEDAQGEGYAYAAASALLAYGVQTWNLDQVGLDIEKGNVRSEVLAARLGAVVTDEVNNRRFDEGTVQHRVWSIA